jgi:hypothetical protein
MHVASIDCTFRRAELSRLVSLELSSVLSADRASTSYEVLVRCTPGLWYLSLHDPLTQKRVERWVTPPAPEQPEPERAVALTLAQLYRASWLELAAEDEPPLAPPPSAPASAALREARDMATRRLTQRAMRQHWSLGLGGGLRLRNVSAALPLPHANLQAAYWPMARLRLALQGNLEAGGVTRRPGNVQATAASAGVSFGVEPWRRQAWSAVTEISTEICHVRLRGSEIESGYRAGNVAATGLDSALGTGVAWLEQPLRIELMFRAGYLLGTPSGSVYSDRSVSLNGPWLGVGLQVSVPL